VEWKSKLIGRADTSYIFSGSQDPFIPRIYTPERGQQDSSTAGKREVTAQVEVDRVSK